MGIHEVGVELAGAKCLVVNRKATEVQCSVHPSHFVFVDGPNAAIDGGRAVGCMHHQLGQHGVVINGHFLAFFYAVIHADTGACGRCIPVQGPRIGEETGTCILRVNANFYGVPEDVQVFLFEGEGVAFSDADLFAHEVDIGNALRNGVFHLQACIHLQEIEPHLVVQEKFHGPSAHVVAAFGDFDRALPHGLAQLRCEYGGRRFFHHFLVPALNAAFPFEKVHDVAVLVCQNLNFNVARRSDKSLDEHGSVSKCIDRFRNGAFEAVLEFTVLAYDAHAFSTAACACFDQQWVANSVGNFSGLLRRVNGVIGSGYEGHIKRLDRLLCCQL